MNSLSICLSILWLYFWENYERTFDEWLRYIVGILRVYCLKTLKKLSIYPLGKTPSAPSEWDALVRLARERSAQHTPQSTTYDPKTRRRTQAWIRPDQSRKDDIRNFVH